MSDQLAIMVAEEITFKPGYRLLCERDKKDPEGRLYYQVECERPDVFTGEMGTGKGGKLYLSPHMNVSELVRKAFQLFMAYEEHETREWFKWRGRAVCGPHIDMEALWGVAEEYDFREETE